MSVCMQHMSVCMPDCMHDCVYVGMHLCMYVCPVADLTLYLSLPYLFHPSWLLYHGVDAMTQLSLAGEERRTLGGEYGVLRRLYA